VAGYEIQLAPRLADDDPFWAFPLWSAKGVPVEAEVFEEEDDEDEDPSKPAPPRPQPPRFETLDGHPAQDRMKVDAPRPPVRLSTAEPIDRYRWRLREDDRILDHGNDVKAGITGGTCIRFTPTKALRRGPAGAGHIGEAGFFFPPFEVGLQYASSTYRSDNPDSGHFHFAVDFNRGGAGVDAGDWVLAAAAGVVRIKRYRHKGDDDDVSDVIIDHAGGFQTLYTHMNKIKVKPGDQVALGQRLGRISDVGKTNGTHLHHQHRKLPDGVTDPALGRGIKMKILGKPVDSSQDDPQGDFDGETIAGAALPGTPQVRPEMLVSVRRASDHKWSRWSRLVFEVTPKGKPRGPGIDPGCEAAGVVSSLSIEHIYDGPGLHPGYYSLRYRVVDDHGRAGPWVYDHSLVITGA
jgi:murein DD-endopeptidase MepM/ murein hydrolase activator NlpD